MPGSKTVAQYRCLWLEYISGKAYNFSGRVHKELFEADAEYGVRKSDGNFLGVIIEARLTDNPESEWPRWWD